MDNIDKLYLEQLEIKKKINELENYELCLDWYYEGIDVVFKTYKDWMDSITFPSCLQDESITDRSID